MAELKKILFVEDDPDIQSVATMALESLGGFEVKACSSGVVAVKEAPGFAPDLVLLDVMMPEMDGPSTLKALREMPAFAKTPVIFMTAKVMGSETEALKRLGALAVIAKPFDPMTLSDTIRQYWEAAQ